MSQCHSKASFNASPEVVTISSFSLLSNILTVDKKMHRRIQNALSSIFSVEVSVSHTEEGNLSNQPVTKESRADASGRGNQQWNSAIKSYSANEDYTSLHLHVVQLRVSWFKHTQFYQDTLK